MAYDEGLADRIRTILAAEPGVEVVEKKMFGGVSFMVDGHMCCGVLKDELVVRVGSPEQLDAALAQPHARLFDFSGRPATGMLYVGAPALTSPEAIQGWVQRAVDSVRSMPAPTRRRRR